MLEPSTHLPEGPPPAAPTADLPLAKGKPLAHGRVHSSGVASSSFALLLWHSPIDLELTNINKLARRARVERTKCFLHCQVGPLVLGRCERSALGPSSEGCRVAPTDAEGFTRSGLSRLLGPIFDHNNLTVNTMVPLTPGLAPHDLCLLIS